MRQLITKNGFSISVDDEDFDFINQWAWRGWKHKRGRTVYARRIKDGKRMHRLLMNVEDRKVQIDHIDGNGLNNCRSNLRLATHAENCRNVNSHLDSKSRFKGVCLSKGKYWQAQITAYGKTIYIGTFRNEIDAAKAYNEVASKAFGEFAKLNKVA